MANTSKGASPKRKLETVRERSENTPANKSRVRKVATTAKKASGPLKVVGRVLSKLAHPFKFLLAPFRTKPARFVGRILNKVLLINYFMSAWKELKQVTWPGRKETRQLTFAVFIFATVFGVMITLTDYGLDKVFKKVILK
ncbi:MAG: preprotein translocase subunit SecE [Candidatus Saccharibacteria bacterium]|nr:preprotein translocase subunit SecE [Candidatus Saccharibacteria bacterium]